MPTATTHALIVTDDTSLGSLLHELLAARDVEASIVDGDSVRSRIARKTIDLVIADLDLEQTDPLKPLRSLRGRIDPGQVLMLASEHSLDRIERASELGFTWYQKKPVTSTDINVAIRRLQSRNGLHGENKLQILGSSPGIQSALKLAAQAALRNGHLTITGEPGVGKRLLAGFIHENSKRSKQAFRHLSCAGLSERVVDAELFGWTDVHSGGESHEGLLQQCHQGILVIDEISNLSIRSQERLLKALALKTVRVVHGRRVPSRSEVRIIASSSDSLEDRVRDGFFIRELFDRIGGVQLELQPLRARKSDIPMLADHFIRTAGQRLGSSLKGIAPDGLDRLMRYNWPGNIRELEEMITRAVSSVQGPWLDAEDLPALPENASGEAIMVPGSTIQEIEKEAILMTLDAASGSTARAARILNMSVRKIQYKLKEYRRESASTLRSETVSAMARSSSAAVAPVPRKKIVFVANPDS